MKYLYILFALLLAWPQAQAVPPDCAPIAVLANHAPPIEPIKKNKSTPKNKTSRYGKLAGWLFVFALALNFVAGVFTIIAIVDGFALLIVLWLAAQLLTAFLSWFFLIRTKMMEGDKKTAFQVVSTCFMVLGLSLAIGGLFVNSLWFGLIGLAFLLIFVVHIFSFLAKAGQQASNNPPPPQPNPEPYINE